MASKFLLIAALVSVAISFSNGQTVLGSYAEVRDALINGHAFVAAIVDLGKCTSHGSENATTLAVYNDQFNEWTVIDVLDGSAPSYIYNEQYYLNNDGYWIVTEIVLNENDETFIGLQAASGADLVQETVIAWECGMGDGGATYVVKNAEVTAFDGLLDYQTLKSSLILGRHIFATVQLDECDPAPNGVGVTAGFYIDDWQISRDGSEDEVLAIVYPWRISQNPGQGGQYAIETSILTVTPNGRVRLQRGLLDAIEWDNEAPEDQYQCQLGQAVKLFAPHDDIVEHTYQTYEEVRDALFTAHELEIIIFGRYCNWNIEESERTNLVYGHRFYNWDYLGDFNSPGPQDYIRFEDVLITPDATVVDEDYRILEDGTVVFDSVVVNLRNGDVQEFRALCPLGTAAIFHAGLREGNRLETFADVEGAVLSGQSLLWEAYLPNCTYGSQFQPGYVGGSLLQMYDIYDGSARTFYAPATAIYRDDFFQDLFWTGNSVVIGEDGLVSLYPSMFNAATWENVTPPELFWECRLGESAWFWA